MNSTVWKVPTSRGGSASGRGPRCPRGCFRTGGTNQMRHSRSRGSRVRHSLDTVQAYARNRGGECWSVSWAPAAAQLWRCKLGREWSAKFHAMNSRGIWCPSCSGAGAGARARARVRERARGFVFERGDRTASAMALRPRPRVECEFRDRPSRVVSVLPVGARGRVPLVLERLTGDRFPRSSLNGVELDGYNARLRIAFEYQGEPVQLVTSCWDDEDDDAASQRELAWQQKTRRLSRRVRCVNRNTAHSC